MANEPAPDARASDLAALPDDVLLKELDLAPQTDADAGDEDVAPEGEDGEGGTAEAETPDDGGGSDDSAGADQSGEGEGEGDETETPAGDEGGEADAIAANAETLTPQGYSVFQGADEVEIPADLKIKFKADGEEREVDLNSLVRQAQMGFYNEARANEIKEFREALPEIEQTIDSLHEENRILREGWARVLSGDEDYFAQEQEAFLRAQSPEARAERAEYELQQERQRQAGSQVTQQASQFVRSLVPEFESLQKDVPEVTWEEVVGKFNILTAPLMVRGQIPPTKFREVERIIKSELRPWAESQHERRVSAKKAVTATTAKATATAAAAKKVAARAVLPQGTHPSSSPPKPPKKYETAGDIFNDLSDIVPKPPA